jgi:hypothetical protein
LALLQHLSPSHRSCSLFFYLLLFPLQCKVQVSFVVLSVPCSSLYVQHLNLAPMCCSINTFRHVKWLKDWLIYSYLASQLFH